MHDCNHCGHESGLHEYPDGPNTDGGCLTCDCDNFTSECQLCRLEKRTTWHYEDHRVAIITCDTCHTPMAVLKDHNDESEAAQLYAEGICKGLFGPDISFRYERRDIPDHPHFHVENVDGDG